jgi:hypothetical protein
MCLHFSLSLDQLLLCQIAKFIAMAKLLMTIKCTSPAGRFDGHGGLPVQYKVHHSMQHVQGYSGSYWALPSGNYLLRITPAATRATANKTKMKTCTHFAGQFNGRGGAPARYCVHCPMEEGQGFTRSPWMLTLGKYHV